MVRDKHVEHVYYNHNKKRGVHSTCPELKRKEIFNHVATYFFTNFDRKSIRFPTRPVALMSPLAKDFINSSVIGIDVLKETVAPFLIAKT
jgi:hypothetical protein